jgi:hypothetical protein
LDEDANIIPVEEVPNQDTVARQIEQPFSYNDLEKKVLWEEAFKFPKGVGESVCWDKYAPTAADIHAIGKAREAEKRAKGKAMTYVGYVTSTSVGDIRDIRSQNGHGFTVTHEPAEGDYHCEIRYLIAGGGPYKNLKTTDKTDLKFAIRKYFGELIQCDS